MQKGRIPVLVSIVLAMLIASMDSTIINTTMPVIVKELGGFELYAWTFASYMIVTTVLSPLAGRLSDLFGRKRIFAGGILLFLLGSLLCGFSQSMPQLVLFRAVQGIGAGFLMPFPAIIAGDLFSIEQRGKIQAFFSAMWGVGAVLAPLLGALFTEYANWRWIFFVNIPICLICFVLLLSYREVYEPKRAAVDFGGAGLFAAGVSLLLAATVVKSYLPVYVILGVLLLLVFVRFERRHPSPIVPLGLLGDPPVRWMIVNSLLSCAALFGTSSYIPLYLQNQGHTTFASGVALLGVSVGWTVMSVPAGRWILKYGYRKLMVAGNALLVLSGLMLTQLRPETAYAYVFIALTVQGLSYGLTSTVSVIGAQQFVGPHQKGVSTSMVMFARNIGTVTGVTIMGGILVQSAGIMPGIRNLFLYGFIMSLISFGTAFLIPGSASTAESKESAPAGG